MNMDSGSAHHAVTRRRLLGAGIASVVLATRGSAVAQQPADLARAKESFNAGAMAYSMGEYAAAIQALDAAYAITPLPAIAFSLAQAERRQYFVDHNRDHLDRAILLFRKYLDQVPSGGRRADAVDALSQLEPLAAVPMTPAGPSSSTSSVRPTRLFITTEAPGAQVSVDGSAPSPAPWIHEVEPGQHRVEVSAEGFHPEERDVVAVAGELIPASVLLREKPSTVSVWSDSDAALYVDGTFVRRGGEGVLLEMPSGAHRLDVVRDLARSGSVRRQHRVRHRVAQVRHIVRSQLHLRRHHDRRLNRQFRILNPNHCSRRSDMRHRQLWQFPFAGLQHIPITAPATAAYLRRRRLQWWQFVRRYDEGSYLGFRRSRDNAPCNYNSNDYRDRDQRVVSRRARSSNLPVGIEAPKVLHRFRLRFEL